MPTVPRLLRIPLSAVFVFATAAAGAQAAHADTTLLPYPGPDTCSVGFTAAVLGGSYPSNSNWTAVRLTVTSASTITTAQALTANDPSTKPVKLVFRADDGTVGTSGWTQIGTLTQASSSAAGTDYHANFAGSVTVTPGTYWVSLEPTSASTSAGQALCLYTTVATQTPWSVDYSASPNRYSTTNNGATFSAVTDSPTVHIPMLTLSGYASTASSSTSDSPAPVLQQVSLPSVGTCTGLDRPDLGWAGVGGTGWSESWAQWVNGGTGGAVCTRTLVYSTSQGAWTLG